MAVHGNTAKMTDDTSPKKDKRGKIGQAYAKMRPRHPQTPAYENELSEGRGDSKSKELKEGKF